MTRPATVPNHDFRTAAAITVAIVAALGLAWRSPPPAPAAPAIAETVAAPVPAAAPAAFDLDTAMRLAGTQVPPELDSFYFFAMLEPAPQDHDVADLGAKMLAASAEHDYLGIAGPDAARNRDTALAAFHARRDDDLSGMILIYLGPEAHREEISRAASGARVELRYVVYPETGPA